MIRKKMCPREKTSTFSVRCVERRASSGDLHYLDN